jgi:hypothetical protein
VNSPGIPFYPQESFNMSISYIKAEMHFGVSSLGLDPERALLDASCELKVWCSSESARPLPL